MGSTKIHLVNDLEEVLAFASLTDIERTRIEYMIRKAKQGYYHDFESPLATPKIQLYHDLMEAGLEYLAKGVKIGEYDDDI